MVLVGSDGLGAVQAKWIRSSSAIGRVEIGVIGQESAAQAIDGRRARECFESGFARRVGRVRVGCEVVVERNVFLKDYDEMLDGRGGRGAFLAGVEAANAGSVLGPNAVVSANIVAIDF